MSEGLIIKFVISSFKPSVVTKGYADTKQEHLNDSVVCKHIFPDRFRGLCKNKNTRHCFILINYVLEKNQILRQFLSVIYKKV